jgi:hypothetical protein
MLITRIVLTPDVGMLEANSAMLAAMAKIPLMAISHPQVIPAVPA